MEICVLKPAFYDRFQCLCGGCKHTCCQEWGITISKEEYNKIDKAEKSDEVKLIIDNTFQRTGKGGSYGEYAKVVFDSNNMCGCLEEDGLCALQMKCGYEVLPNICKVFPRTIIQYKDTIERSLSTGCEKVISLLIEEKDGILYENVKEIISSKEYTANHFIGKTHFEKRPIFNYYYDIKTLGLSILENRVYTIDERMMLLGMAFHKVDMLEKEKKLSKIPSFVNEFLESIEDRNLISFGNSTKNNNIKIFDAIFISRAIAKGFGNEKNAFVTIMNKVRNNLGIEEKEVKSEKILENEIKATFTNQKIVEFDTVKFALAEERYQKYFKGREYILENIMVNSFMFNGQPFYNQRKSVWENYMYYISCYNITRFIIMGYMVENSTDDDLIHCVAVLSRSLLHSTNMFNALVSKMKKNNTDTLAHMALLIL